MERGPTELSGLPTTGPRLAVRAVIVRDNRLLLVNAFPGRDDLWCAPGGGVEPHQSLLDNLVREVHEETGLVVEPGPLVLVSEFHSPERDFHQVELFYRSTVVTGGGGPAWTDPTWTDPAGVVSHRRWFALDELAAGLSDVRVKPSTLPEIAFGPDGPPDYDPLELMVD